MSPRAYKGGGVGQVIRYGIGECWLGLVLAAVTDRGVCALLFGDSRDELVCELRGRFAKASLIAGGEELEATMAEVIAAVERPGRACGLALDVEGTLFEQKVWAALRAIPAGERRTYSQVAEAIGAPSSVRAVARACAANPVGVLTPCHRVVRRDGTLAGYRWGVERKAALLEREGGDRTPDPERRIKT